MDNQLILASGSPRRAELLTQIGLPFRVIQSNIEEQLPASSTNPGEIVSNLALAKAKHVSLGLSQGLVIGADTIVVLDHQILGKPADPAEAISMLLRLSGRTHSVFTGVALVAVSGKQVETGYAETKVSFRSFDVDEVRAYVSTGEPLDKAGAYGIQGKGAVLVETINGCYFNVVGLPLSLLVKLLARFGISVW